MPSYLTEVNLLDSMPGYSGYTDIDILWRLI